MKGKRWGRRWGQGGGRRYWARVQVSWGESGGEGGAARDALTFNARCRRRIGVGRSAARGFGKPRFGRHAGRLGGAVLLAGDGVGGSPRVAASDRRRDGGVHVPAACGFGNPHVLGRAGRLGHGAVLLAVDGVGR